MAFRTWGIFACLIACLLVTPIQLVQADDFRVETVIQREGGERRILARTLTLFYEGKVYDFLEGDAAEIAVFDEDRNQIALIDQERQIQTLVLSDDLLAFTAALQIQARESNALYQFFADPEFDKTFNANEGRIILSSPYLTYRASGSTEPDHEQAVYQYSQFANWYARLNATERGGSMPFARLALNRALVEHAIMPRTIELTIRPPEGEPISLSSHHTIGWELSTTDHERISQVISAAESYEVVDFDTYRSDRLARRDE